MKFADYQSPEYVVRTLRSLVSVQPAHSCDNWADRLTPATGFYVGEDVIVTSKHTATQSTGARIHTMTPEGRAGSWLDAKRLRSEQFDDLSVSVHKTTVAYDVAYYGLQDESHGSLSPLRIGRSADFGEQFLLVGITHTADEGYVAKFSEGRLHEVRQRKGEPALLLFDADVEFGMSGGPVLRADTAEVIGVLSGTLKYGGHEFAMAWQLVEENIPWTLRALRPAR